MRLIKKRMFNFLSHQLIGFVFREIRKCMNRLRVPAMSRKSPFCKSPVSRYLFPYFSFSLASGSAERFKKVSRLMPRKQNGNAFKFCCCPSNQSVNIILRKPAVKWLIPTKTCRRRSNISLQFCVSDSAVKSIGFLSVTISVISFTPKTLIPL